MHMGIKQNFHTYVCFMQAGHPKVGQTNTHSADKTISLGKKSTSLIMLITYAN